MTNPDMSIEPSKKKECESDFQIFYCAQCGQPFGKLEIPKECKNCHLKYHTLCGFSNAESDVCKSCMYKEHEREYARIKELEKKRASFGCYLLIFLFLSVIGAGIYGFGYFSGASSEFVPFIIFSLLAIVTLIAIFRNIPILRE